MSEGSCGTPRDPYLEGPSDTGRGRTVDSDVEALARLGPPRTEAAGTRDLTHSSYSCDGPPIDRARLCNRRRYGRVRLESDDVHHDRDFVSRPASRECAMPSPGHLLLERVRPAQGRDRGRWRRRLRRPLRVGVTARSRSRLKMTPNIRGYRGGLLTAGSAPEGPPSKIGQGQERKRAGLPLLSTASQPLRGGRESTSFGYRPISSAYLSSGDASTAQEIAQAAWGCVGQRSVHQSSSGDSRR
jgi:hypothetical protein